MTNLLSTQQAVNDLVNLTGEVSVRQAEATAMEAVAEQQRKQTYLLSVLAIKAATDVNMPNRHRDPPHELADEYLKELFDKGGAQGILRAGEQKKGTQTQAIPHLGAKRTAEEFGGEQSRSRY